MNGGRLLFCVDMLDVDMLDVGCFLVHFAREWLEALAAHLDPVQEQLGELTPGVPSPGRQG